MKEFFNAISQYDFLINVVSCLFTVLALVFTLYFWLLDHLSEDESKFIEGKDKFLKSLKECLDAVRDNSDPELLLEKIQDINNQLEVILNYRFWSRSKKQDDYRKISTFYQDSKYLISTMRRVIEAREFTKDERSLVIIKSLDNDEMKDIQSDYRRGLTYIIDFIENWN